MFRMHGSVRCHALTMITLAGALSYAPAIGAQATARPAAKPPVAQKNDEEYTALIKKYLSDPRISTELVDHLPASATVPTPLKFLGKIVGAPGELTHVADIHNYMRAVAKASPRAKVWSIGKTEEGREMIVMAIADEATIAQIDKYKGYLKELTDPRKTTEARAQQLLHTAKPVYWITSGMHSPETGGPEMLIELSYRLVVEETPLIQNIRKNVITLITPVVEPDGRDKVVDAFYFNKKYGSTVGRMSTPYWGRYVQHDDNRDGMGQMLDLTKNITRAFLDWTPQVLHDLHESVTYLYVSTGTGPYNEDLDPITVNEWWLLAENDIMEMTKRGVPGVWTYNYYDGWVPNYMFFIAHEHNAIGRFYEVQSYGSDTTWVRPGATTTSKEWYRPNPPLEAIKWSPRANTNIQESAILFALNRVATDRHTFLENYWIKNKNAVNKGKHGPVFGWVIPAGQHAAENAAEAVNDLRAQGLEFQRASSGFRAGQVEVKAGDYIVRGDQPYRTLADMYFSLQNFAPDNPAPYDDTGWTFPLMRNLTITAITDSSLLKEPMAPITADVRAPGGISGSGSVVAVENNQDNNLVTFRFKFPGVKMQAAEAGFDAAGQHFTAGALIIPDANQAQLGPALRELGLTAVAMSTAPSVRLHDLVVPRIGYVHSWTSTQDEGWVRGALDHYGVPFTYFGEPLLKVGNLRSKYDVIIYPSGGTGASAGRGGFGGGGRGAAGGAAPSGPVPYKKTAEFPSLGTPDSTDDLRATGGPEAMKALYEFVQQGGTLITEGGTASIFPGLDLTPGVKTESAQGEGLFARGTILRGVITDRTSPLVYGYQFGEVPVYFNGGPLLNAGAGATTSAATATDGAAGRGARGSALSQYMTPMAEPNRLPLSPWDPTHSGTAYGALPIDSSLLAGGRGAGGRGAGGRGAGGGGRGAGAPAAAPGLPGVSADPDAHTRVVMQFPAKASDMLLSGTLVGGDALASRAQLVDESVGKGHIVMFAFRPYWRWQTQGTFAMGFNAIVNWNHLDAK
jgi:zinc carboxypeptidase